MSTGHKWYVERTATDLAQLLRAARAYLATTRPHVCCDCGHIFTLPALTNGRRCMRCGVENAPSVGWRQAQEANHG